MRVFECGKYLSSVPARENMMKAPTTLFAIKALVLAVPFVLAQDLLRDLAHDLARTRELARDLSLARELTRELTHVYDLAYTSGRKDNHMEPE